MAGIQSADDDPGSVSIDYISAATNRHSRAAHSSNSSVIAFGSSSFVALWSASDNNDTGVHQTLPGHDGLVTCVRFKPGEDCFFSADDKGFLRCWKMIGRKWSATFVLQAHRKSISALAVFEDCVVTGSSDSTITIWRHVRSIEDDKETLEEIQRLDMKGRYPLDAQIATLPGSADLIMAISATERNISIFTRSGEKFVRAASLSGHEDWVKSLAFQHCVSGPSVLTLASGSQDGTIRLWNMERMAKERVSSGLAVDDLSDDLLDSFEAALGDVGEGEEGGKQISMKRHILTTRDNEGNSSQYSITFDALLIGHEAGVTCLDWRPSRPDLIPQPMLLSTSTDSSLILWAPSPTVSSLGGGSASLWINQQRFGDVGGQRLGGFVGGLWNRQGAEALAWGWSGGWRRWRSSLEDSRNLETETWKEVTAISGHSGPVRGICWSQRGEYLISAGPDQTTRIHGNVNVKSSMKMDAWHEISRPQVHGYDLVDAAFLTPTRFVSIADEKVARIFDAPRSFVSLCKHFNVLQNVENESERPIAASVPPLGLSNKAMSGSDLTGSHFQMSGAQTTERRPFEGELAISTLWPEIEKLFGHGYELHAIATSHSGQYVATSCRATSPEHAGIKVYDTTTWQLHGPTLQGHQLSITRIAFSPDDRFILSVSRDRTWMIHESQEDGYTPVATDKSHVRIIWDCAWACEGDAFATASRDKTVKIWQTRDLKAKKRTPITTIKTKEAATAVAFTPASEDGRRLLAVGMENGEILVSSNFLKEPGKWQVPIVINRSLAHTDQIHRLQWRPTWPVGVNGVYQLASSSEDGTLRILRVQMNCD